MNLVLNILWMILGGGIVIALEYFLAGLLLCITIIGIPFGLQAFKLAQLSLFPFGADLEEVKDRSSAGAALGLVGNVLWFICAGLWIFISHIGLGLGLAVTIIGIPFAIQHLKLGMLALWPFGRVVE